MSVRVGFHVGPVFVSTAVKAPKRRKAVKPQGPYQYAWQGSVTYTCQGCGQPLPENAMKSYKHRKACFEAHNA